MTKAALVRAPNAPGQRASSVLGAHMLLCSAQPRLLDADPLPELKSIFHGTFAKKKLPQGYALS